MPRARKPLAAAKASGATVKDPQRYRTRGEFHARPLGQPSVQLCERPYFREAWESLKQEVEGLTERHRAHMEIAATLRARIWSDPNTGITALNQLRLCLSAMGANPSDESKVSAPDAESDDPDDQYFN